MPNNGRKGKWQPFDGLEGYQSALDHVDQEKGKAEKPILFPDELEELDRKMMLAINENREVEITYYQNGYFYTIAGKIENADSIGKAITVSGKTVKINTIQNITVL
jgi:hypothetical protein